MDHPEEDVCSWAARQPPAHKAHTRIYYLTRSTATIFHFATLANKSFPRRNLLAISWYLGTDWIQADSSMNILWFRRRSSSRERVLVAMRRRLLGPKSIFQGCNLSPSTSQPAELPFPPVLGWSGGQFACCGCHRNIYPFISDRKVIDFWHNANL